MGLELIILVIILFFGGFIWLGYAVWKKKNRSKDSNLQEDKSSKDMR